MSGVLVPQSVAKLLPKVITKRDVIKGVKARWRDQYGQREASFRFPNGRSVNEISRDLEVLNYETATENNIASIIGNDSWTKLECDLCGNDREAVVNIPNDYGERRINICGDCADAVKWMLDNREAQS